MSESGRGQLVMTGLVALAMFCLGIVVATIDAQSWRLAELECEIVRHQDAHARGVEK